MILTNINIIDGTGREPYHGSIIISKGKIKEITTKKMEGIDLDDGYALPGFIDAHVHLMMNGYDERRIEKPLSLYFYEAINNMRATLDAGVTTVRDAGFADLGVKLAAEKNLFPSPRILITVAPLSPTGGHFDGTYKSGIDTTFFYPGMPKTTCDGVDEVRKRVREVIRAGADFVKIATSGGVLSPNDHPKDVQFSIEELQAIVEEAKFRGKKVMAHAHGNKGILNAIKAGVHSIEHGTFIDRKSCRLMIERGIYLVPTFLVTRYNSKENKDIPNYMKKQAKEISKVHKENMELAYEEGVKMVMGTDSGVVKHGNNLKELEYMCEIGMDPMEAIQSGTKVAAECLLLEDKIGTIEKNKIADIIVVKKNPLDDISVLSDKENIILVMKEGKIYKKDI